VVRTFDICARVHSLPLFVGDRGPTSIDLSTATKLRDVVFRPDSWSLGWITKALQTITPNHRDLRQIIIHIPRGLTFIDLGADGGPTIGEPIRGQCLGLDHLLIQFWESRSIRPKVIYAEQVTGYVERLLPGITERGIINLV
jgi:hypothetical protein